jgi:serine/threonine protein kinase
MQMEDRIRPKSSKLSLKRAGSRLVPSSGASKSSKVSPLQVKRKAQAPVPSAKVPAHTEHYLRPVSGKPQHRRVKSDPIPSSPYTGMQTAGKAVQSTKKTASSAAKPQKNHRRIHSDHEEHSRETLVETVKNAFVLNIPLITTLDFYRLGKPLGKGAFGKVYLGVHKLSGLRVAIKTIEKSVMQDERTRKKVFQEVYIMNKIHDKNVIRLLELFESPRHLMIVLEYAGGGDLLQLLRNRGRLAEAEAKPIFAQVVDAVIACHREEVIHRDIKLDNILLNEEMTLIKLCDFGVSRLAKFGVKLTEQCGTPAYLAPEIIVNEGYEPFFVDVWSMGILLYALLSATVPFKAKTIPELHKIILRGKYDFPDYFSEPVRDLIGQMLNPVPQLRAKLADLKKHCWFASETLESSFHSTRESRNDSRHFSILKALNEYGFPNDYVENSLKSREINHASASYNLLDINIIE